MGTKNSKPKIQMGKAQNANKKPVIYAFIDSQNLNLGVLDQGWKLNTQIMTRRSLFPAMEIFVV
jgi:hypothetical protein